MSVFQPQQLVLGERKVTIRSLAEEDLQSLHNLNVSVHFNRILDDLRHYLEDKGNLVLGLFNEREDLLSTCMGTLLSEADAYISMWITRKDLQGQGFGKVVLKKMFEFLGDRNLILDSGPDTVSTYAKYGFKTTKRYNFYSGQLKPFVGGKIDVATVHRASKEDSDALTLYEQGITHLHRKVMFSKLTESGTASCFVSKLNSGLLNGYGIVKQNGIIYALYADDLETARALFDMCVRELQDKVGILKFYSCESKSDIISKLIEGYTEEEFNGGIEITVSRMVTQRCPPVLSDKEYVFGQNTWSVSC